MVQFIKKKQEKTRRTTDQFLLSALSKIYETFIHESFAPFIDAFCQLSCKHIEKDKSMKTPSLMSSWKIYEFLKQHDLTPRIYVLHKITIALKFMSYINQNLRPSYQTALNLCLT